MTTEAALEGVPHPFSSCIPFSGLHMPCADHVPGETMVIASEYPYRTLHRYEPDDMAGLPLPSRVPCHAESTNTPTNQSKNRASGRHLPTFHGLSNSQYWGLDAFNTPERIHMFGVASMYLSDDAFIRWSTQFGVMCISHRLLLREIALSSNVTVLITNSSDSQL